MVHLWEASELKQCRLDKYGEIGNHAWKKKQTQTIYYVCDNNTLKANQSILYYQLN